MDTKLHILAIEPFYGGARRLMLESLARRSRHRWTLLRLPPRRLERRLEASAQWFAEVLLRRPVGDFDVLFTSEVINLADLYAHHPELGGRPAVVYFHDNQLPAPGKGLPRPTDHVNLFTALEARQIWFNSLTHLRLFTARAHAMTYQHSAHFAPGTVDQLAARTVIVNPPVELGAIRELETAGGFERDPASIFVDLRRVDAPLLSQGLMRLAARNHAFRLVTIGPRIQLPPDMHHSTIPDHDEDLATVAMAKCGVYLSADVNCSFDARALMALSAGMRVLAPESGAYPEIIPTPLHSDVLYQPRPDFLASALQDLELPAVKPRVTTEFNQYEAGRVVAQIDERLSAIASTPAT